MSGLDADLPIEPPLRRLLVARTRGLLVRGAELSLALGLGAPARMLLARAGSRLPNSRRLRGLVARAFADRPTSANVAWLRKADLDGRLRGALKKRDLVRVLELAAHYAASDLPMPMAAGELLARHVANAQGRARLRAAAEQALARVPSSPFLLYLVAMAVAEDGNPGAAGARVRAALEELLSERQRGAADLARARSRFDSLRDIWRVTDQIAREATGWADDSGGGSYADLALIGREGRMPRSALARYLQFKEPLLQARDEAGYLAACLREFQDQRTTIDRLRSVSDMLRQSVRRQASYARAWDQAGACYDELAEEIARATEGIDPSDEARALPAMRTLVNAMGVARRLGRKEEVARLKAQIAAFAGTGRPLSAAFWLALPELVAEEAEAWEAVTRRIRAALPAQPRREHELRAFLRWALVSGAFEEAQRVFDALPPTLRQSRAALFHVNILQRHGRFAEALQVLRQVNAALLSRPGRLRPYEHWSLLRRHGELRFLVETARIFARVPQPRNPRGVIVLAARNIDQLRKYPLAVLLELRRRGWAVVNLVEGLLPSAPTGRQEIDILAGCITMDCRLRPAAAALFPELSGFVPDPANGRLDWMGLNLSHSLREDARIARRAYDVDFSCPSLQQTLGRLCDWTAHMARALLFARATLRRRGFRIGFLTLFNSRLPDSVFRLFCDVEGDARNFFALQTANGYENYFANFRNPISTRCVIRNMTLHREVRSATFPTPANFKRYVAANRHRAAEVLERVEAIARARRIEGSSDAATAAEAAACAARIAEWRARGGRVVCLFGRVVCDSAVPFDGGPAHADLRDWVNHSVESVRGSDTLLLIKPHPHELNEQIATYLNQTFRELIDGPLPDNAIYLGHRWFDIAALAPLIDLGTVYNGTVAVELALLGVPCLQMNHFGPIDYPLGHPVVASREDYRAVLRFERPVQWDPALRDRAALWLDYMSNGRFALPYRYHARPVTNRVVYPPWWVAQDIAHYLSQGDPNVAELAGRVIGERAEPDGWEDAARAVRPVPPPAGQRLAGRWDSAGGGPTPLGRR